MNAVGDNVVFLLCVPRSGSSMTTFMLQNHSRISAVQEMWFLMKLYDLRGNHRMMYGGAPILKRFFQQVLDDETFIQACRAFASHVYQDLLNVCGGTLIVDKSPRYYYILEFLDQLFPTSRRIFLARNPLDIAASYKKLGRDEPFDLVRNVNSELLNMKIIDLTVGIVRYMDYFSEKNDRSLIVSYEELVSWPKEQLSRICRFLGLDYEEGMEQYGKFLHSSESDLFFSMGVGDPSLVNHEAPHTQSIDQWDKVLTNREVEALCRILGKETFNRLGYGEAVAKAEALTKCTFPSGRDEEWMNWRIKQLHKETGCRWEPSYRMTVTDAGAAEVSAGASQLAPDDSGAERPNSEHEQYRREIDRLRMMLRLVEERLQHAYEDRDRIQKQYMLLRSKVDKIKSLIPLYKRFSRLAHVNMSESRKRK